MRLSDVPVSIHQVVVRQASGGRVESKLLSADERAADSGEVSNTTILLPS